VASVAGKRFPFADFLLIYHSTHVPMATPEDVPSPFRKYTILLENSLDNRDSSQPARVIWKISLASLKSNGSGLRALCATNAQDVAHHTSCDPIGTGVGICTACRWM
jgi:hypothetical protein